MNILYITNHLNIGGITSYVFTLAGGLKKKGHNIYVASSGGELLPRFMSAGINYIPIPIKTKQEICPGVLISAIKLSRPIKENHIEIVHTNSRTTQVLGCLLHKFTGIPHISTCHGFFKKRFSRMLFPCWGQKVIAISASVRGHLINDFGVDEKTIAVVHNGVDVEKFSQPPTATRQQIKINFGLQAGPVVGIIARLSEEKGHVYLLKAMQEVSRQIPDTQLLIVGDGRTKEGLVNLTKLLGLTQKVIFIPSVMDTQEILSIMDIFVLPSLKEGLGLALMEAMASGLAVIGADVGGIKGLIKDGAYGLLVKPADAAALSGAIIELLRDEQKRIALGQRAKDFIQENFSQEQMVRETEKEYLECLSVKE